jgi:hypothetical protein
MTFHKSKYKNTSITIDNIRFASKKEAEYYLLLCNQLKNNKILNFERQVSFTLVPPLKKLSNRDRGINYIADFVVKHLDSSVEVIDVKGFKTDIYLLKRKLMCYIHDIIIKEV